MSHEWELLNTRDGVSKNYWCGLCMRIAVVDWDGNIDWDKKFSDTDYPELGMMSCHELAMIWVQED